MTLSVASSSAIWKVMIYLGIKIGTLFLYPVESPSPRVSESGKMFSLPEAEPALWTHSKDKTNQHYNLYKCSSKEIYKLYNNYLAYIIHMFLKNIAYL